MENKLILQQETLQNLIQAEFPKHEGLIETTLQTTEPHCPGCSLVRNK